MTTKCLDWMSLKITSNSKNPYPGVLLEAYLLHFQKFSEENTLESFSGERDYDLSVKGFWEMAHWHLLSLSRQNNSRSVLYYEGCACSKLTWRGHMNHRRDNKQRSPNSLSSSSSHLKDRVSLYSPGWSGKCKPLPP